MGHCRDCDVCTRLGIIKLLRSPITLTYNILFSWNVGLFIKKCPECGHWLSQHQRRGDGSFKD